MFKLLTNYIREQKTSLVQVFGLGFVIIIMVSSFLSLTFATNYISDQYWTDIAQEEFHQNVPLYINRPFRHNQIGESWLNNISYAGENDEIDQEKMVRATFQIQLIDRNPEQGLYVYRFYYQNSVDNIHVGEEFASETGHNYVDFKLNVPFNYPNTGEEHINYVQEQAALIDNYLYDPSNSDTASNKTNFFLTSKAALAYYNNNILNNPVYPWATRTYQESDIATQARMYQWLVFGMLYGDNISWTRIFYLNDLLITGKVFSFIQTTVNDVVNAPILVSGNTSDFDPKDLQDDEILIYQEFAQENNLKIGQDYIFAGYKFHIKGFATSAIAANNAYYFRSVSDNKNQTVAWVNQVTMNKIRSNPYTENYSDYFFPYNPEIGSKHITDTIDNEWVYQYFHQKLINDKTLNTSRLYAAIKNGIQNQLLLNPINNWDDTYRIRAIESAIWTNINLLKDIFIEIASTFLSLIFIVVSVIIFIVIFKMIDRNKRLMGILKAHGYPNWQLNLSLVIATMFPVVLFSILGAALAIVFGHFIVTTYSTAVILVNYGWPFYYQLALMVIFIPFVALAIVSFMLVAFLLRVNALTLINNSWSKNKYNFSINALFTFLATKITKNFNYYNKLALTTSFRSFGKMLFVVFISIFASTLLLFSLSSSGLINNLLGLQFASINYNFNTNYNFDNETATNFINDEQELLYQKESVSDIKSQPSLYLPIRQALEDMINNPNTPKIIDFRYGYIMGSELFTMRQFVEDPQNWVQFPLEFQAWWHQNIYFIDYLTNGNGQNSTDLMINFGLLPYDEQLESPYTNLDLDDAHDFDINTIDTTQYYYDNSTNVLVGDWSKYWGASRIVNGIDESASRFLDPGFRNTNFNDFSNLTLEHMTTNQSWINNNFLRIRDLIIKKFNIQNPDTAAVKIVPMVASTVPGTNRSPGGYGNNIGKTVLYRYQGLDLQTKYIIGVVYDGARNLLQKTILMPKSWINNAIFGSYTNLAFQFANSKFTNFTNSELQQYLPIISTKNDYLIDLSKLNDANYISIKGLSPGLTMIYDVNAIRDMFRARQYSLQVLIILFSFFSVILSFMIIIIISNINIRDNLVLIDILRSLGYTSREISYIFLLVTIPILIIFSLFSIFIAPILTGFIASAIANFLSISVPVIFEWWYVAIALLIVLLIYFLSYIITWSLNVNKKQLMTLTK